MADSLSTQSSDVYRRALERTATVESFDAEGTRRTMTLTASADLDAGDAPAGTADASTSTDIGHHTLGRVEELPPALLGGKEDGGRYSLVGLIGKGAAGSVYEVRDNHLGRVVAVKMLNMEKRKQAGRRELFIHEARVTARLAHPNIMPVYDIGLTENKEIFFTMKKAAGHSLGDAVREEESGAPPAGIATLNDKISVMLKVGDAVAYAHAQGYIHQDIKPDNIMIGEYGEVLLMDWGSALPLGPEGRLTKGLVGTPVFMSPEQARKEYADVRSDVYCLGATLFYLLTLRCPTWGNEPETFWAKKRAGTVDEFTAEEQGLVPASLRDIVLKALAVDPVDRYPTAAALSEDLKRFQAGLAVSAHRDSLRERFGRWYRANSRLFWVAVASLSLVAAVGGLLVLEKRKEAASWRRVYGTGFEQMTTAGLRGDWYTYGAPDWLAPVRGEIGEDSAWRVEEGRLVADNSRGYDNLTFRHGLTGNMRVEWDLRGVRKNANYNCYIAGVNRTQAYTIHVGGWNNTRSVGVTKGASYDELLDYALLPSALETGRWYRFRMEKEDEVVRFFIDDAMVLEYRDPDALFGPGHQTFGFENSAGNKLEIDNVEVFSQPLPERIAPIAVADRLFQLGLTEEALGLYEEIAAAYPRASFAPKARYKSAVCLARLGESASALERFGAFEREYPGDRLAPYAAYERTKILNRRGRAVEAESLYVSIARRYPGHPLLRAVFFAISDTFYTRALEPGTVDSVMNREDILRAARNLEKGRRAILRWGSVLGISPDSSLFMAKAAQWHMTHGRYETVVERYPNQRRLAAEALYRLGRYEEVLEQYPDAEEVCCDALNAVGDAAGARERYPDIAARCARASRPGRGR